MYVRGYLQGSEHGRVVTIVVKSDPSQIGLKMKVKSVPKNKIKKE